MACNGFHGLVPKAPSAIIQTDVVFRGAASGCVQPHSGSCLFCCAVTPFIGFPTSTVGVVAWVNVAPGTAASPLETVLSFGTTSVANSVVVMYQPYYGYLCVQIGGSTFYSSNTGLADGTWHLVAVSWSASAATLKLYLDGGLFQTLGAPSGSLSSSSGCLLLGRAGGGSCSLTTGFSSVSHQLTDTLGEVTVWRWVTGGEGTFTQSNKQLAFGSCLHPAPLPPCRCRNLPIRIGTARALRALISMAARC